MNVITDTSNQKTDQVEHEFTAEKPDFEVIDVKGCLSSTDGNVVAAPAKN